MKPICIHTYFDYIKGVNDKDPKCKVGDHVRISNYKNLFAKRLLQIGLKKLKILFHGHILLMISMVKNLLEHSMKKNCRKQTKTKRKETTYQMDRI